MIIRELRPDDLEQIKNIHEKYYKDDFEFPDFFNKFLCAFVVVDDEDLIITAGGVRTIVESVIVTDKSVSTRERKEALLKMLEASIFVTNRCEYDMIHAFVQDESWIKQLKQYGFADCKNKPLFIPTR